MRMPGPSPIEPRGLRIREAARYSALGVKRLRRLAKEGQVVGFPDPNSRRGDWIFDRLSIDAYREAQAGTDVVRQAALDVAGRIGL